MRVSRPVSAQSMILQLAASLMRPATCVNAGPNVMNVVMVGAECAPWSKTGARPVTSPGFAYYDQHCLDIMYTLAE